MLFFLGRCQYCYWVLSLYFHWLPSSHSLHQQSSEETQRVETHSQGMRKNSGQRNHCFNLHLMQVYTNSLWNSFSEECFPVHVLTHLFRLILTGKDNGLSLELCFCFLFFIVVVYFVFLFIRKSLLKSFFFWGGGFREPRTKFM